MSKNKIMDLRLNKNSKELLDKGELVGKIAWGWVFGDTNTHGNHPFPDGMYIHTSTITQVEDLGDDNFIIHTLNSKYEVI